MKIPMGKFTLRSDAYCFWVEEECVNEETGKKYNRRVAGYAGSLPLLYAQFAEHKFRNSDAETVRALLKELSQVSKDLAEVKTTAVKEGLKLTRRTAKEKGIK